MLSKTLIGQKKYSIFLKISAEKHESEKIVQNIAQRAEKWMLNILLLVQQFSRIPIFIYI